MRLALFVICPIHVGLLNFMAGFRRHLIYSGHTMVVFFSLASVLNDIWSVDHSENSDILAVMAAPEVVELEEADSKTTILKGFQNNLRALHQALWHMLCDLSSRRGNFCFFYIRWQKVKHVSFHCILLFVKFRNSKWYSMSNYGWVVVHSIYGDHLAVCFAVPAEKWFMADILKATADFLTIFEKVGKIKEKQHASASRKRGVLSCSTGLEYFVVLIPFSFGDS